MRYDRDAKKLIKVCNICGKVVEIPCTLKQYQEIRRGSKLIQDTFPDISPDVREILISNICGECYDKMFEMRRRFIQEVEEEWYNLYMRKEDETGTK